MFRFPGQTGDIEFFLIPGDGPEGIFAQFSGADIKGSVGCKTVFKIIDFPILGRFAESKPMFDRGRTVFFRRLGLNI